MKIYINSPKESWVVDRFVTEWKEHNKSLVTNFISKSDIVWIIAPWTWKKLSKKHLRNKKVMCTIHHIDDKKFNKDEFFELDQYVDSYHIISKKTYTSLSDLTKKKIFFSPFWIDQKKWYYKDEKINLRKKFNFSENDYLIGSFQRDTEGSDNQSPKLEKGPDYFLEIVSYLNNEHRNLKVVLTGKRRNYVKDNLEKLSIPYKYFEMVDFKMLNELYNSLDLYIVSSRVEGGPQSILESAITKTPIISTNVGIANHILSEKSIYTMENFEKAIPNIDYAHEQVQKYTIPEGFVNFINEFTEIYEN